MATAATKQKVQLLPVWVRGEPLQDGLWMLTLKFKGIRIQIASTRISGKLNAWNMGDWKLLKEGEVIAHHPLNQPFAD